MMKEIWKPIKNYEGLYEISNYGKIKNLNYNNTGISIIIKNHINGRGYLVTTLVKNNQKKVVAIHRIVAETFLFNPNNLPCVNHKNGIKTDNRVENLEFCTHKENIIHAWSSGLCKNHQGKNHYKSRKVNQYDLQGNFIKEWECISLAAKELKIHSSNITRNCQKKIKTAYGSIWEYKKD